MVQPLGPVVRQIHEWAGRHLDSQDSDGELLRRFSTQHDEGAFAAVVRRHGSMVLGVCQRVLGNVHAAEDAFQATFLALVRRAGHLEGRNTVGNWLYTVAYHAASRARADASRRRIQEQQALTMHTTPCASDPAQAEELRTVIDQELTKLPEKYRSPVVLCYLEGRTNEEAAQLLGWTKGTVSGRLARARDLLNQRLTRRGVALAAGGIALQEAPVSAALVDTTVRMAVLSASGNLAAGPVTAIAEGALRTMLLNKLRIVATVVVALSLVGTAAGFIWRVADRPEETSVAAFAPLPTNDKAEDGPWNLVQVVVDDRGDVVVGDTKETLQTLEEIEPYLARQFSRAKARALAVGAPASPEKVVVVVQAPAETQAGLLYPVLQACRKAGFRQLQIAASGQGRQQSRIIEYAKTDAPLNKPELTLWARTSTDEPNTGKLSDIIAFTANGESAFHGPEQLDRFLRTERPQLTNKDDLPLQAAEQLKLVHVIEIVDVAILAGFRHVHFVAAPENLHSIHQQAMQRHRILRKQWADLDAAMDKERTRLDVSQQKEDKKKKLQALLAAFHRASDEAIDIRLEKISGLLAIKTVSLAEAKETIDQFKELAKSLEAVAAEFQKANASDDFMATRKDLAALVKRSGTVCKLLQHYQTVLERTLLE